MKNAIATAKMNALNGLLLMVAGSTVIIVIVSMISAIATSNKIGM